MPKKIAFASAALASLVAMPTAASAQDKYMGEIIMVGYSFCPIYTVEADGRSVNISQYTALYSLYGTTYGGDGIQTFKLPDLRGRVAKGQGQGQGLAPQVIGQSGGFETVTLTTSQMPAHIHAATTVAALHVQPSAGDRTTPVRSSLAISSTNNYSSADPALNQMKSGTVTATTTVSSAGGNQPFSVVNPYVTMRYCVVMQGIYPSRP